MIQKTKIVLTIILILSSFNSNGQYSKKIDSLLIFLKTDKSDTSKISHLNSLCKEFMFQNPDTSIILGNQAIKILSAKYQVSVSKFHANDIKLGILLSACLGNLSICYCLKGDYSSGLDYNLKALTIDKIIASKTRHLKINNLLKKEYVPV